VPFRLKKICQNGVPLHSGTTTPLNVTVHTINADYAPSGHQPSDQVNLLGL